MGTLSVSSVRRTPCLSMDAKKTKLMNHLVEIRKNLVTDRVKENKGKAYVEEKGRKLLTIRGRGNRVILSGGRCEVEEGVRLLEKPFLGGRG